MYILTKLKVNKACKEMPGQFDTKFLDKMENNILKDANKFLKKADADNVPLDYFDIDIANNLNEANSKTAIQYNHLDDNVRKIKSKLGGHLSVVNGELNRISKGLDDLEDKIANCTEHSKLNWLDNAKVVIGIVCFCTFVDFSTSIVSIQRVFKFPALVIGMYSFDMFYLYLMCVTLAIGLDVIPSIMAKKATKAQSKFWDVTNKIYFGILVMLFVGLTVVRYISAETFVNLTLVDSSALRIILKLIASLFFTSINIATSFISYNLSVYKETVESLTEEHNQLSRKFDKYSGLKQQLDNAIGYQLDDYLNQNKARTDQVVQSRFGVIAKKAREAIVAHQQ